MGFSNFTSLEPYSSGGLPLPCHPIAVTKHCSVMNILVIFSLEGGVEEGEFKLPS